MKTRLKLLVFGFLMIQLPKLCIGQTSLSIPTSEQKIWNVVSQEYENCKSERQYLVSTLDTCKVALESANIVIRSKDATIDVQNRLIGNLEYTVGLQSGIIATDKLILQDEKSKGRKRTIGFTVGGFGFGVLATTVLFLVVK